MPNQEDIALIAHLMRKAGFGASRQELEDRAAKGYETTVEELLHPEDQPAIDDDILFRFMPGYEGALGPPINQAEWVYRMINTQRPLEEKLALFWHQLFATGKSKVDNPRRSHNRSPCSGVRRWAASESCWWNWPRTRP